MLALALQEQGYDKATLDGYGEALPLGPYGPRYIVSMAARRITMRHAREWIPPKPFVTVLVRK